jgi:O-methyltransferase involved in polyketide biosynthesis
MMTTRTTAMCALAIGVVAIAAVAVRAQQHPVVDMMANHLIEKYQTSSCDQLWQQRSQHQSQPKTPQQQEAIAMLRANPQMRADFIDKIAAPIANKLFDCGMIP